MKSEEGNFPFPNAYSEGRKSPEGRENAVRMIAWEVTRSCNLSCVHCRAASHLGPYPGELSTGECLGLIDDITLV